MKLDSHLIAKTSPCAKKANTVFWEDYRITVLTDRLFRIEKNGEKVFRDQATQRIWFRDFAKNKFTKLEKDGKLYIGTDKVVITIDKSADKCYAKIKGKKVFFNNAKNLKGTYRTLDCCDGDVFYEKISSGDYKTNRKITLSDGVCSLSGVAVIDDSESLTLTEAGKIKYEKAFGTDEYVFCHGDDYAGAVKDLYKITGCVPLVPRFALGNWWSRYHRYTDKEYLKLLDRFSEEDIPLSVATIDMDWHYSDFVDEEKGITASGRNDKFCGGNNGWTGFSWNKNLFPDYKAFLKEVKNRNLKITLNLHPADGVRWWEDAYEEFAKKMKIDPKTCRQIPFDMIDETFINNYFRLLLKPYEHDGVKFWWIDWQQGTVSKIEGLDPLWSLNHYQFLDNAKNNETPLILSRYDGVGAHRYPVGFSGDTLVTWQSLKYIPYFTATATNIGYTWWSHDIGGHMLGEKNDELYLRYVQFGVFSPINRLHCSNAETMTKEPWAYKNGTGLIAVRFLRLRHSLIPYLYTMSYKTHKEGIGLIQPLYYTCKDSSVYNYPNEYTFGELLVCPITSPKEKDGYARVAGYLPKGKWTDIFTLDEYRSEGEERTFFRQLDSIPVFAKEGSVVVKSADGKNSVLNPTNLVIEVYSGNGEFTLFEDDRELNGESEGFTLIKVGNKRKNGEKTETVEIEFSGDSKVVPENRNITVCFKNEEDGEVSVTKNGKEIKAEVTVIERVNVKFCFDCKDKYVITLRNEEKDGVKTLIERARRILTEYEGDNTAKLNAFNRIKEAKTVKDFIKFTDRCNIPNVIKAILKETV